MADEPSPWVRRFAGVVPPGGRVLDVAAGAGRHTRFFHARGHPVTAVDRDTAGLDDLADEAGVEVIEADLEGGSALPFAGERFAAVVVTRYLHRPLLPALVAAVDVAGVLIYETFARGQERHGRPTNPDFLLRPGELLDAVAGQLRILAFEDLELTEPSPACIQRICARR